MQLTIPAIILLFLISSCGGSSGLSNMTNFQLIEKYTRCLKKPPSSPGRVTACENLRRECELREQKRNDFICPNE